MAVAVRVATSLDDYARLDARSRAERIVRAHYRFEQRNGAVCPRCLVEYPCDARRAAEDVLAVCGAVGTDHTEIFALEYKGHRASIRFSIEDRIFHGRILGLGDDVSFEGGDVDEIEKAFHDAVDDHLSLCRKLARQR